MISMEHLEIWTYGNELYIYGTSHGKLGESWTICLALSIYIYVCGYM